MSYPNDMENNPHIPISIIQGVLDPPLTEPTITFTSTAARRARLLPEDHLKVEAQRAVDVLQQQGFLSSKLKAYFVARSR